MSSTPTDAPLMEVRDIYKSFGRLEILRGISLELHRGEILAIVGASGAGKTTLLQVIGTLDAPDRGEVIIGGERLSALSGNRTRCPRSWGGDHRGRATVRPLGESTCRLPQSSPRLRLPVSPADARVYCCGECRHPGDDQRQEPS